MDIDRLVSMLAAVLVGGMVIVLAYQVGHTRGEIKGIQDSTCRFQETAEVPWDERYDYCKD